MTLNNRILDFLDGSLSADDEAELLHTLSVSPEQRAVLRGFMEQRSLLARDSKAIQVPIQAERRLWKRLDEIMPVAPHSEDSLIPVPVESAASGTVAGTVASSVAANSLHGLSLVASIVTLFAGLGIGYFSGVRNAPMHTKIVEIHSTASAVAPSASGVETNTPAYADVASKSVAPIVTKISGKTAALVAVGYRANSADLAVVSNNPASVPQEPAITLVTPKHAPPVVLASRIGGNDFGITPSFHAIAATHVPQTNVLNRFELRVEEGFGRQSPNNAMTSVSWPLITNSSISALFQLLPHSNLLWVGGGFGSASVTTKELSVGQGDPQSSYIPLSQDVLQADTVHKQATYFETMAELRFPAFAATDLTLGGGYGWASLGQMMFGELGFHYNISENVGTQIGLRVMRFSYDLSAEKQAAIQAAPGGLAISNAVVSVGPSFNTELNAGLFFDF